jgi:hypothetical protein
MPNQRIIETITSDADSIASAKRAKEFQNNPAVAFTVTSTIFTRIPISVDLRLF